MLHWKKVLLTANLLYGLNFQQAIAQTDSTKTLTSETIQPDLKLDQDKKRQNKTEKLVFVSCLFIVLTTILLYNVRSK